MRLASWTHYRETVDTFLREYVKNWVLLSGKTNQWLCSHWQGHKPHCGETVTASSHLYSQVLQSPDCGNAKGHSWKCMFQKRFINAFSKHHRDKLRRIEGNLKVVDLGEQTKKESSMTQWEWKKQNVTRVYMLFFTWVKKFFAPFDLVSSIHSI